MIACVDGVTCKDVGIATVLALFVGTFVAIPVFAYLFGADFIANKFGIRWNLLSYIALVAVGCAAYAAILHYEKGVPFPTTTERWLAFQWDCLPLLTTAGVLLVGRIAKSLRPPPAMSNV